MAKVFQDQIPPSGGRKYSIQANPDGTSNITDVTEYLQDGTPLSAEFLNGLQDGTYSVGKADRLSTPRKIGNAEFDGSADITLEQMGAEKKLSVVTQDITSSCTFNYITPGIVTHTQYGKLHVLKFKSLTINEYTWSVSIDLPASVKLPVEKQTQWIGVLSGRDSGVTQHYMCLCTNSSAENKVYFLMSGQPIVAGTIIDAGNFIYLED